MNLRLTMLVFLGGGAGSLLRYYVGLFFAEYKYFYVGTLLVNILASLFIGIFLYQYQVQPEKYWIKFFLSIGFCGGLSTFSTFSLENMSLIHQFRYTELLLNIFLSVFLALIACIAGYKFADLN